jgi:hypothetical protein
LSPLNADFVNNTLFLLAGFMALLFIVIPLKAEPGIGTFSFPVGCQRVVEPVLSPLLYKPALKCRGVIYGSKYKRFLSEFPNVL